MDTKTIGAIIITAGLSATIAVAVPETEAPIYTDTGITKGGEKVVEVVRSVCEPFEYKLTASEIASQVEGIQTILGTKALDEKERARLERIKTRFIQDAVEAEKKNEISK